ncbi:MAG: hypothetical protein M1812_002285 [Candelaria pacifica]|nr:MAG: hypothetical protein M1812_002285 [Candelaria pacifica]
MADLPYQKSLRINGGGGHTNDAHDANLAHLPSLDDVLRYIHHDWDFMTEENCIPVQVALQLMDSSSLGRADQYEQFKETHEQLQKSLKAIVNEHHQGFNSSIGTFHKIQSSIQTSQNRIRTLRESLVLAKSSLSTTKPELKGLATSSQGYDEMLQILALIEQLQVVPEKLEASISEKHFLAAVEVLQGALRMIRRSEMEAIGALSDLRITLSNQEASLTDILVEELHNHLYLKSPYCEDRWKPRSQGLGANVGTNRGSVSIVSPGGRSLYQFLDHLDTSSPMLEDASRNAEADSFYYIQLIIESLSKMGRLDVAVDRIEQRLPVELFRVVDKTNNEVDQRHPSGLRSQTWSKKSNIDTAPKDDEMKATIIHDFLSDLYAKFEAIAEGHRVLHDVVMGILKREGTRDAGLLTGGFKELWKLYQSEIRSILHDYLATDGSVQYRSSQVQGGGANVFQRSQRDKTKRMFKLSDMDSSSNEIAKERDDLDFILKSSVPGLVSDSRPPQDVMINDSSQHHDGSGTGHKLLVEPSVFNMSLLLPPSLSFLQQLKNIVPPGSDIVMSTLTSFLDDFLVNVFHPQLDETLSDISAQTFIELDAFQEDPQWPAVARKPIFKGTSSFFNLITTFCSMLDTIPHDQAFSQLIITQMVTYYDKCFGWYKALVTRAQAQANNGISLKAAACFAQSPEFHNTITKLRESEGSERHELLEKENALLILDTSEKPLEPQDIISDRKAISSLCLLYTSMKWLASKVSQLRHITDRGLDSSHRQSGHLSRQGRRWTLLDSVNSRKEASRVYLPMTHDSVSAFDGIVNSYQELAATALFTLHFEIRCRIIDSTAYSFRGNYQLEQSVNEPEPNILALNANLVSYDESITHYLREQEHNFITVGLGHLLDQLLVTNANSLKTMNSAGCERMQLNILVLQQNLKNIEKGITLSRSAQFFNLFAKGPEFIVAKAKETGGGKGLEFNYDELKVLVELCYSEALNSSRRDVAMTAKKALSDHLLQLSEALWQS